MSKLDVPSESTTLEKEICVGGIWGRAVNEEFQKGKNFWGTRVVFVRVANAGLRGEFCKSGKQGSYGSEFRGELKVAGHSGRKATALGRN